MEIADTGLHTGHQLTGTRRGASGDLSAAGVGIEVNYYAFAFLHENTLVGNPTPLAVFSGSRVTTERDELHQT